jgi:hypothetical protein
MYRPQNVLPKKSTFEEIVTGFAFLMYADEFPSVDGALVLFDHIIVTRVVPRTTSIKPKITNQIRR